MPSYRMPEERARLTAATVAELHNALCAARCSAHLAGMETGEFVVRELLLTVIEQIDRTAESLRRFYGSP